MSELRKNPVAELRKIAKQVADEYGAGYDRAIGNNPDLSDDFGQPLDYAEVKDRDTRFRAYQAMKALLANSPAKAEAIERAGQLDRAELFKKTKYASLPEVCRDWVWVTGVKRFVRRSDGLMWDVPQFNAAFDCLVRRGHAAADLFEDTTGLLHKFETITFSPGKREMDGEIYNTWRASDIKPAPGDTTIWDTHLVWLVPDALQRDYLLDWLAWVYQNPNKRPGYALLLIGETMGTGKSAVARVLEYLIGPVNTQRPKNSSLKGQFNSWAYRSRLVLIEELMQIGRREVANELRDIITEPTVEINIKMVPQFTAPNYSALFAVSNNPDALPMVKGDRRWLVIESPVTQAQKSQAVADNYFAPLMSALDDGDKDVLAAIAAQLAARNVSHFQPGNAPMTAAKRTMIELSATAAEDWIERNRIELSGRTIVNVHDDIVTRAAIETGDRSAAIMVAVRKWLKRELGMFPLGDVRVKDRGSKKSRVVKLVALGDLAAEVENYPGGLDGYKDKHDIAAIYEAERERAASEVPPPEEFE